MVVDITQARAFLQTHTGQQDVDAEPIGRGEWSQAYAFRWGDADCVIRFGAYREDFDKDLLASSFAGPALPIPRVIEVGEAFDGHYCIAERVPGGYIDEVDGAQMRALLPALFAMLDAMREVDVSSSRGWGGWGADGNGSHQSWAEAMLSVNDERAGRLAGWRERLEATTIAAGPFEAGYRRLADLVERVDVARHLIHMDLLHYNVLVAGDRITGVLDWGCAMYGDHLYDLAWLCFWQPWYPAWREIDFRGEALRHYAEIGLEVPRFDERLTCCMLHMGLDGLAYQAWAGDAVNLPLTAERLRAVM